jgi:hypothetical protein
MEEPRHQGMSTVSGGAQSAIGVTLLFLVFAVVTLRALFS